MILQEATDFPHPGATIGGLGKTEPQEKQLEWSGGVTFSKSLPLSGPQFPPFVKQVG